jgi:hypothetical protein
MNALERSDMKILVLTIRAHGEEDDIYVFDNREVNVLPTIKEWLKENDIKLTLPDHVTDTYSFMDWFYDAESDDFFVSLQYKELLSE